MKPLPAEAEEFLGSLRSERGLSLNTVAAYRRDLLDYFTFLDEAGESGSVSGFAEDLTLRGLARSTRSRKLAAVRGYHRFLVVEGISDDDHAVDQQGLENRQHRGLFPARSIPGGCEGRTHLVLHLLSASHEPVQEILERRSHAPKIYRRAHDDTQALFEFLPGDLGCGPEQAIDTLDFSHPLHNRLGKFLRVART